MREVLRVIDRNFQGNSKHNFDVETRTANRTIERFVLFVVIGESNPLLTKHLEQYESPGAQNAIFGGTSNQKPKVEPKTPKFPNYSNVL